MILFIFFTSAGNIYSVCRVLFNCNSHPHSINMSIESPDLSHVKIYRAVPYLFIIHAHMLRWRAALTRCRLTSWLHTRGIMQRDHYSAPMGAAA